MVNNTNNSSRQSSQLSITSSHLRRPNGLPHRNNTNNHHVNKSNSLNPSIWTTNTSRSSSKSNFTSGSNDFHFLQASDINTTKSSDVQNGSTSKLLPYGDDQSNAQVSQTKYVRMIQTIATDQHERMNGNDKRSNNKTIGNVVIEQTAKRLIIYWTSKLHSE